MATKKKKKKAAHYNGRPLSARTKFVLGLPRDMPRDEVIERAAKAGLTISRGLLNSIRQKHKARWDSPAPAPVHVAEPAKNVGVTVTPLSADESDFMGLVLGIGYNRAASLLASFRVQYFDALKNKKG